MSTYFLKIKKVNKLLITTTENITMKTPFLNKIQQYLRPALELDMPLLCMVKDLFMISQTICIILHLIFSFG